MLYAFNLFGVFISILVVNWKKLGEEFILNFKFQIELFRDQINKRIVKFLFLSVLRWSKLSHVKFCLPPKSSLASVVRLPNWTSEVF